LDGDLVDEDRLTNLFIHPTTNAMEGIIDKYNHHNNDGRWNIMKHLFNGVVCQNDRTLSLRKNDAWLTI
jgi:hypothetical protein